MNALDTMPSGGIAMRPLAPPGEMIVTKEMKRHLMEKIGLREVLDNDKYYS